MMKLEDRSPVLPRRGGYLFLAALTAFMGSYNLWVATAGLYRGSISVFTKHLPGVANRAAEPAWYWANVAGRVIFAALLLGCAVACVLNARSASAKNRVASIPRRASN